MTELDLYKFCEEQEMDWRGDELILWIHSYDLKEFTDLVGGDYFSEGNVEVALLSHGVIAIEMNDLCEHFDIDPERIRSKE